MKKTVTSLTLCLALCFVAVGQLADDCSWTSPASASPRGRTPVKTRTAREAAGDTQYNKGKAISIADWFKYTCGLDAQIPADLPLEKAAPVEMVEVSLRGYVMATKFMRTGDHDIHVELADSADWNADHVVVEMSPGAEYCDARHALMEVVRKDGCDKDECIMKKPVRVTVRGLMLVGTPPQGATNYCSIVSTRGIHDDTHASKARGIFRLQPVLAVKRS